MRITFFITIFWILIAFKTLHAQVDTILIHAIGTLQDQKFKQANQLFKQSKVNSSFIIEKRIEAAWHSEDYAEMKIQFKNLRSSQKAIQYYYKACFYVRSQKNDSAFIMLEKLLAERHKYSRVKLKTDSVLLRLKLDERWLEIWKQEHYKPYDLKVEMAQHELDVKNYDLSLMLLDELIDDRSYRDKPLYLRSLLFYEQGILRSALEDVNEAIKKEDDNANYYALKARILLKSKRERKAFKMAQKAISKNPYNPCYYGIAAKSALADNRFEDGVSFAETYLTAFPNRPEALFIYAQFIFRNGSCMKALPYINKAISKQKRNPELYFLRAQIYQKCKVYAQAVKDYGMCLDFWPRNYKVLLGRGICRHYIGDKSGSCRDLNNAFDLGALEADKMIREWCR